MKGERWFGTSSCIFVLATCSKGTYLESRPRSERAREEDETNPSSVFGYKDNWVSYTGLSALAEAGENKASFSRGSYES